MEAGLKLSRDLPQAVHPLHGVAAHNVGHLPLCIVKPGGERKWLLHAGRAKPFNQLELILNLNQKLFLPGNVPTFGHLVDLEVEGHYVLVANVQLLLQCRDVLDIFKLKSPETGFKGLLFGE